jgi:hypothetical protein
MGILPMSGMAVPAMSRRGLGSLPATGETPMSRMAETAMPRWDC